MYSQRTKISLAQFLALQGMDSSVLMFRKHNISEPDLLPLMGGDIARKLTAIITNAAECQIASLLEELARTQGDLRSRVTPKYRYDDRFKDLQACLMLDGYRLDDQGIAACDPTICETPVVEDDLTRELKMTNLPDADNVIQKFEDSANAFRMLKPDYNHCLNDARIAFETLAKNIAQVRSLLHPGNFEPNKWGSVISYLKTTGFIEEEEEKGLTGVYGFISKGSHRLLGLSDEEFTRLGRNFVAGMCWFLVKRYRETCKGNNGAG